MTVRCWVHVYTFKRGSQQKYSDNIIFYLSFCLWDYWLSQQTYTCQTSTVPMNQAPAKTTKNLCYLSICIWYKKKKRSRFGLDKSLFTALSATVSPLELALSSQGNNIIKAFSDCKWKQEWLGFPGGKMKFRERLLSFWAHQTKFLTSPCSILLNIKWK